jgi:ribosomal protein L24
MKVGDLVMIKQGYRTGKLALVTKVDPRPQGIIRVVRGCGDWFGYYKRDLEVIA